MNYYYSTAKAIIRSFHMLFLQDCRVYGEQNLPAGAKIIAGNHPNATDGLFLPFVFKEMLHFFVQGDLFNIPFVGWILANAEQIKVIPGAKNQAFDKAAEVLKQDKVVAIFPEARLNPDGQPVKSGTGAVRLSLMAKVPIIPIGFYVPPHSLHHISRMKNGRTSQGHWQTGGHCYLHIGTPWLLYEEFDGQVEEVSLRELTESLMAKINEQAQLAMQMYVRETGKAAELASFSQ